MGLRRRRSSMTRLAALLIAATMMAAACGADASDDPSDLASVVAIATEGCQPVQVGTGSIVGDGIVLTAAHVVAGARSVEVVARSVSYEAIPVVLDTDIDIAVLRVDGLEAPALRLSSRPVRSVAAIAITDENTLVQAPLRHVAWAVTTDIHRDHEVTKLMLVLDVLVEVGDSGAAVLDGVGDVVGVIVSVAPQLGISFALHIEEFAHLLTDLPSDRAQRGSCSR